MSDPPPCEFRTQKPEYRIKVPYEPEWNTSAFVPRIQFRRPERRRPRRGSSPACRRELSSPQPISADLRLSSLFTPRRDVSHTAGRFSLRCRQVLRWSDDTDLPTAVPAARSSTVLQRLHRCPLDRYARRTMGVVVEKEKPAWRGGPGGSFDRRRGIGGRVAPIGGCTTWKAGHGLAFIGRGTPAKGSWGSGKKLRFSRGGISSA
jgi:hypothetical protein